MYLFNIKWRYVFWVNLNEEINVIFFFSCMNGTLPGWTVSLTIIVFLVLVLCFVKTNWNILKRSGQLSVFILSTSTCPLASALACVTSCPRGSVDVCAGQNRAPAAHALVYNRLLHTPVVTMATLIFPSLFYKCLPTQINSVSNACQSLLQVIIVFDFLY